MDLLGGSFSLGSPPAFFIQTYTTKQKLMIDPVKFRNEWLSKTGFDYIGQQLVIQFAEDYAKACVNQMEEDIEKYTSHLVTCSFYDNQDEICNCGLDKLLNKQPNDRSKRKKTNGRN